MKLGFLGDHDELAEAAKEGDCSQLRAQKTASLDSSEGFPAFLESGRMTFPSNPDDVAHSLVRLTYDIGLASDKDTYGMIFNYAIAPALTEDFKGNIKDLTIRPSDKIVDQAWEKYGPSGPLNANVGKFRIVLDLPKLYRLTTQQYVIRGKNNEVVGEIPAPFLQPVDK